VAGLVVIGLLRGMLNRNESEKPLANQTAVDSNSSKVPTRELATTSPTNTQVKPAENSILATTPTEDYAAQKQRDLDAISDLLVSGSDSPEAVNALAGRFENVDPEVRASAREAAVQLDNTNFIPQLQTALEHLQDLKEKAAILDAIAYLQLPADSPITNAWEIKMLNERARKINQSRTNAK
jgi:hypothetical protein